MNSDGKVEVDDLEGSVENIASQIAHEVFSHNKIYHFCIFVLFIHDSFVLLQLQRLLTAKLKKDGLVGIPDKLIDNMSIQIAVIEREKQSARDSSLKAFNVDLPNLLHFESNVARQVV